MAEKMEMPDLKGMSTGDIIDALGECRFEMNRYKKLEGYYKEALGARMDAGEEGHGRSFWAGITAESRMSLDSTAVKEEMGEDWWVDHCKETEFNKVSVKPYDPNND